MKQAFNWLFTIAFFSILSACTGNSSPVVTGVTDTLDSKGVADLNNKIKYDSTNIKADAGFAVNAADGGMMEIQTSQLALKTSTSADLKSMAQKMVDDHSAAGNQLKALAAKDTINLPTAISADNQETFNKLAKMTGKDFDKAYVARMVDDHKATVSLFEKESETGNNAGLKQWAATTLPTIKSHLQMWEDAQNKMK